MGIQQLTKLASNVLKNIKKLPPRQMFLGGGATIFATGLLVGRALWGDSFEKRQNDVLQNQNDSLKVANDSISKELATLTEQLQAEEEKKNAKFKYVPPSGKDITVDTLATYMRNGNPVSKVGYFYEGAKEPFEIAYYNPDGEFSGYTQYSEYSDGDKFYVHYDENGKWNHEKITQKDGTEITTFNDTRYTDKKGKYIIEDFDLYVTPERKTKERIYNDSSYEHLIQEKHYKDGLLQYTVTPKYNKDGDLIKRDTVWVNK